MCRSLKIFVSFLLKTTVEWISVPLSKGKTSIHFLATLSFLAAIVKVNKTSLASLMNNISLASVLSPKDVTASKILTYIRAKNNSRGSNVNTLYKLVNNKVEALEFQAKENKRLLNIKLRELKIKSNILIAGIIRDGKVVIPNGDDVIMLNDHVLVVTTNQFLDDLNDILE